MSDDANDRTKPIRDLLGSLSKPVPRPRQCGGAIVPATRDTWRAIGRKHNVDFVLDTLEALPADGSQGEVRVACEHEVLSKMGVGGLVTLATCARCAGVESDIRKSLADLLKIQVH